MFPFSDRGVISSSKYTPTRLLEQMYHKKNRSSLDLMASLGAGTQKRCGMNQIAFAKTVLKCNGSSRLTRHIVLA